jgi:hypothetical protein
MITRIWHGAAPATKSDEYLRNYSYVPTSILHSPSTTAGPGMCSGTPTHLCVRFFSTASHATFRVRSCPSWPPLRPSARHSYHASPLSPNSAPIHAAVQIP